MSEFNAVQTRFLDIDCHIYINLFSLNLTRGHSPRSDNTMNRLQLLCAVPIKVSLSPNKDSLHTSVLHVGYVCEMAQQECETSVMFTKYFRQC